MVNLAFYRLWRCFPDIILSASETFVYCLHIPKNNLYKRKKFGKLRLRGFYLCIGITSLCLYHKGYFRDLQDGIIHKYKALFWCNHTEYAVAGEKHLTGIKRLWYNKSVGAHLRPCFLLPRSIKFQFIDILLRNSIYLSYDKFDICLTAFDMI